MLYNRPVSLGVDYFISNLEPSKSSLSDKNVGGFLKHKSKSNVEEREKAILDGRDFEPISCEWTFMIL